MKSENGSSDGDWEQLCREIDEFVFSESEESEVEEAAEEPEKQPESQAEDAPVHGATLAELQSLWGDGKWKVTALHLADYIAQKDYLPVQHCCGQIHD